MTTNVFFLHTVLAFFLFFASASCTMSYGQLKVSLDEYETTNRVFTGYVGENARVTFDLNVHAVTPDHLDFYSVEGWYHYDKYKVKIPLAGIYTDQLILYHFTQGNGADTVLNFLYDDGYHFWDAMDLYATMDAFEEKMTITYGGYGQEAGAVTSLTGQWTNGEKELPIVVNGDDLNILQRHSVLTIENGKDTFHVDLAALKITPYGNSVHAYKNVDGKIRVLLDYRRPSKPYAPGMCGGGEEAGFLWLEFDKKGTLLAMEDFLMESCLLNLQAEQTYEDDEGLTYLIMGSKENGDQVLRLDKATLLLSWRDAG